MDRSTRVFIRNLSVIWQLPEIESWQSAVEQAKQHIGRKTEVIDLHEKSITPGIIDAHLHLLDYAWSLERINLEPCRTELEVVTALKSRQGSDDWVLGKRLEP